MASDLLQVAIIFSCVFVLQLAKTTGNVFATDAILATLMCCTRSTYSWDIIIQKIGNKIFLDKRDDSEFGKHSKFHTTSVSLTMVICIRI